MIIASPPRVDNMFRPFFAFHSSLRVPVFHVLHKRSSTRNNISDPLYSFPIAKARNPASESLVRSYLKLGRHPLEHSTSCVAQVVHATTSDHLSRWLQTTWAFFVKETNQMRMSCDGNYSRRIASATGYVDPCLPPNFLFTPYIKNPTAANEHPSTPRPTRPTPSNRENPRTRERVQKPRLDPSRNPKREREKHGRHGTVHIRLSSLNPSVTYFLQQNESTRKNARARTNPPSRGQLASKPRSASILHHPRPPPLRHEHEPRPLKHARQHRTTLPIPFSPP